MLEHFLDDLLVVGMKLHSRISEWVSIEKNPYSRVDIEIHTYKALIEDLEEHEVFPEARKIFQQSRNKFNKFNKFKLCLCFPSCTKYHSDNADYYQIRGKNFRPASLYKHFKK